ncbi:hypothetical protein MMC24_001861 [Lignoscripta atroalba]|nr:hypothetical protein [Lignoscripta atroalba]
MPPAAKKRKLSAATTRASTASTPQRGIIFRYGKISKSQTLTQLDRKEPLIEKESKSQDAVKEQSPTSSVRKRALDEPLLRKDNVKHEAQSLASGDLASEANALRLVKNKTAEPSAHELPSPSSPSLPSQLRTPRKKVRLLSAPTETPTLGARTCLLSLALTSSSPPQLGSSSPPPSSNIKTPPTSPISPCCKSHYPLPRQKEESLELPEELQDLIDLHASFLTALSLHYAHHGSLAPVDLRVLRPSVERSWGKRRISTDDIRKIFGILGNNGDGKQGVDSSQQRPCPLSLSDYGNGKICVELADIGLHNGHKRRLMDVENLKLRFTKHLRRQWENYTDSLAGAPEPTGFIAELPLASITPCSSLIGISPLLAKGQRRLTDLKAEAIKAQITNNSNNNNGTSSKSPKTCPRPAAVTSRSSDLLTRILAKQRHQSTLPLPPSPQTLARKSALQRLEEVIPVLDILTTSGSRSQLNNNNNVADGTGENDCFRKVSFTMSTLVQHLQMSLRNPISKDEAVKCVNLLAEEVAPEWLGVREIGKVVGVTVRVTRSVGKEEMVGRIQRALEKS